jgi:hypothetical protein
VLGHEGCSKMLLQPYTLAAVIAVIVALPLTECCQRAKKHEGQNRYEFHCVLHRRAAVRLENTAT